MGEDRGQGGRRREPAARQANVIADNHCIITKKISHDRGNNNRALV
jgi:hypothetical protein